MILYFLVDRSGTPLFTTTLHQPADDNDRIRIQFLPLLAIQDLMRSTFGERFRYVRMGGRTVVFCEVSLPHDPHMSEQINRVFKKLKPISLLCPLEKSTQIEELHYIAAIASPFTHPPSVSFLDSHLHLLHHALKFKLGPRFPTLLSSPSATKTTRAAVTTLLSRLTRSLSTSASGALAGVEQVEVNDELRKRCRDILTDACDSICSSSGVPVRRRGGPGTGWVGAGYGVGRAGWLNAMVFLGNKLLVRCQSSGGGGGYGLMHGEMGFELCPEDLFAVMVHVEGFLEEAKGRWA